MTNTSVCVLFLFIVESPWSCELAICRARLCGEVISANSVDLEPERTRPTEWKAWVGLDQRLDSLSLEVFALVVGAGRRADSGGKVRSLSSRSGRDR